MWSHEARFQRMMGEYCTHLPTKAETTAKYLKEVADYHKLHPDEKAVDMRPYTAGSLGRDQIGTGDFKAVSQFCWDNHRFQVRSSEAARCIAPSTLLLLLLTS